MSIKLGGPLFACLLAPCHCFLACFPAEQKQNLGSAESELSSPVSSQIVQIAIKTACGDSCEYRIGRKQALLSWVDRARFCAYLDAHPLARNQHTLLQLERCSDEECTS